MGRKNKVKKLGPDAEAKVMELRSQGKSLRDIADTISARFGDISANSVSNYLKKGKDERLARMTDEQRGKIAQRELEKIIQTGDKLDEMESKLDTILNDTLDESDKQDVGQILQVMKEVRKLMEFQKEYIENVTQPQTQINNVEVTNNTAIQLSEKLMEYEEEGIITIHEPNQLKR